MKYSLFCCLIFCGVLFSAVRAAALPADRTPSVEIEAQIVPPTLSHNSVSIEGTLRIEDFDRGFSCLYLPFNDPDFRKGRVHFRHFAKFAGDDDVGTGQRRSSSLEIDGKTIRNAFLIPLPPSRSTQPVRFKSEIRLPFGFSSADFLVDGFHPIPMKTCDFGGQGWHNWAQDLKLRATITTTRPWEVIGATAREKEGRTLFSFRGSFLPLFLLKRYRHQENHDSSPNIQLYFQSPEFPKLLETIRTALRTNEALFGPFPYEELIVVETSHLEAQGIPGIVCVNRPRQWLFKELQFHWLNWSHWIAASAVGSQWFGANLNSATERDSWMVTGFIDFATLETLSQTTGRFNFFNSYEQQLPVALNYRQFQEVNAHLLQKEASSLRLTDADFASTLSHERQPRLSFVRFALALRQMKHSAGARGFAGHLTYFFDKQRGKPFSPKDFVTSFDNSNSPISREMRSTLRGTLENWLTKPDWPDLRLESVEEATLPDGRIAIKVLAAQDSDVSTEAEAQITTTGGKKIPLRLSQLNNSSSQMHAEVVAEENVKQVVLDPDRQVFDVDRFNNSNRWPGIKFFPGNVDSLPDDSYLFAWLPYLKRLPGDPFVMGFQGTIMKYLSSGLNLSLEASPSTKQFEYAASNEFRSSQLNLDFDSSLVRRLDGRQTVEFSVRRDFPKTEFSSSSFGLRFRRRGVQGIPSQDVYSAAAQPKIGFQFSPCQLDYSLEGEWSPPASVLSPGYRRFVQIASTGCLAPDPVHLGIRLFDGLLLTSSDDPSPAILFRSEDVGEANLRLDIPGLRRFQRIRSANLDLDFPLKVPAVNTGMLLSTQIRGKTFFDQGYAEAPGDSHQYRLRSAGLGLVLPFGGDLSGIGSLTISHLSLITVLYRSIDDEINRHPAFLFDITGAL